VEALEDRVGRVEVRMDRIEARMDRLESELLNLNVRVDGFGEDVRQRFRVLNERIAKIA
jgi:hypothetical protein